MYVEWRWLLASLFLFFSWLLEEVALHQGSMACGHSVVFNTGFGMVLDLDSSCNLAPSLRGVIDDQMHIESLQSNETAGFSLFFNLR